jgi:hypothetical protein
MIKRQRAHSSNFLSGEDARCSPSSKFTLRLLKSLFVHHPEKVPGVVEATYHELIKIPSSLCAFREKHRIGLQQLGRAFSSISTAQQMLEIVFDVLEGILISINHILPAHMFAVLRYLRFERNVLHRDISKGNLLYTNDETTPTDSSISTLSLLERMRLNKSPSASSSISSARRM